MIIRERGRVRITADGGDLGSDGWTRNLNTPKTDLNINEDGKALFTFLDLVLGLIKSLHVTNIFLHHVGFSSLMLRSPGFR